jgi:inosine/xanthosine triphosphatase
MREKLKFVVGSANPVKVGCVASAASLFWPDCETCGVETDSGVGHQPITDEEMQTGALNRARSALEIDRTADYGVGIEGGVLDRREGMWAYAWVVIIDRTGRIGCGQSGRFLLPTPIAAMIRGGLELGAADDLFFSRANSKQKEGAVGILSQGRLTRQQLYEPAVTFALFPFIHPDFYSEDRAPSQ